jgi:mono/diheme cytochrome c family protein
MVVIFGLSLCCVVSGMTAQPSTPHNPEASKLKNPVAVTPASIAEGRNVFQRFCVQCHGTNAQGGAPLGESGPAPPDLTDPEWRYGSSDGEIYFTVKNGVPPDFFMEPWKDRIEDNEIWNIVNYLKSLARPKKGEERPP